jgi:hypothetical protein
VFTISRCKSPIHAVILHFKMYLIASHLHLIVSILSGNSLRFSGWSIVCAETPQTRQSSDCLQKTHTHTREAKRTRNAGSKKLSSNAAVRGQIMSKPLLGTANIFPSRSERLDFVVLGSPCISYTIYAYCNKFAGSISQWKFITVKTQYTTVDHSSQLF